MQNLPSPTGEYPILCAGPDWLTATAKGGYARESFALIADEVFTEERAAGGDVTSGSVLGYVGRRASGFFLGYREHDAVIVLSGPRACALTATVAQVASNVSRLDIQATIACGSDAPHLGIHGYHTLARSPKQRGRKGRLTLTQSLPRGETLNVNSRRSDAFGRVYDKATEAKLGAARTLWRYEVEFKRAMALHHSHALIGVPDLGTHSSSVVHDWFDSKGLRPMYTRPNGCASAAPLGSVHRERNILAWFEDTLSLTVARSINRYGRERTLTALGLVNGDQARAERSDDGPTTD